MSVDINPESGACLSVLMDGEAGEFEVRRTLDLIGRDPELRRKWERYHLAAAALRGEPTSVAPDLSGRIAAALEREPGPRNRTALRAAGRVAVAASVAFLTVVGVHHVMPGTGTGGGKDAEVALGSQLDGQGLAPAQSSQQVPVGIRLPPVRVTTVSDGGGVPAARTSPLVIGMSPAEEREVRRYVEQRMLRHTESAAVNHQGLLPFARLPQEAPPAGQ